MGAPEVRYVRREGVSVAYQTFGSRRIDLLCIPGWVSNIESQWRFPPTADFYSRLGAFARVIQVDRRGTGLSDRFSLDAIPPLEVTVDDFVAALDDAGSEQAAVFGFKDGCLAAILLAAMHPQRISALGLFGAAACGTKKHDYPWQWTTEEWEGWFEEVGSGWGTEAFFRDLLLEYSPSLLEDDALFHQTMTFYRSAADTSAAVALERQGSETDVRLALPSIHVPTLVVHRIGDRNDPVDGGRFVAEQIDGARFVELPGEDAVPFAGDVSAVLGEFQEFLTGIRPTPSPDLDRVLATVLFTDIVASTQKLAELGDARWKELVSEHDALARAQIRRFRGSYIESTGDGLLATFDGPARAVRCAQAIGEEVRPLGIEIRSGCHTGEIELANDHVRGIAVHIGARVMSLAAPSQIMVSSTVRDLVAGSGLTFDDIGEHELKGVPDRWRLYRVVG